MDGFAADPTPTPIRLWRPVDLKSSQRRSPARFKKRGKIDEIKNKCVLSFGCDGGQITALSARQLLGLCPRHSIGYRHSFVPVAVPSCGSFPAGPALGAA